MTEPLHIVATIATYRRPNRFQRLLHDLLEQPRQDRTLSVLVWSDGMDSQRYVRRAFDDFTPKPPLWLEVLSSRDRRGRDLYWKTVTDQWAWVRQHIGMEGFPYAQVRILQLDDDFRLHPKLLTEAEDLLSEWSAKDPQVYGVRLHRDGGDRRWGLSSGPWEGTARRMDWVDGGWYGRLDLLTRLNWKAPPVSSRRWVDNPKLGSGVWQACSKTWYRQGLRFVQPYRSLVLHDDGRESKMNPQHPRKGDSAHTLNWDPTT